MRIEQVQAGAFGPFVNSELELAPGMTVVCGPNEAGKSSWHAALYAAICGVRRGRGAPKTEDADFAERHHPWERDQWDVSATIRLEDGRRVLLHHDLAGRVNCSAIDADLGRDYSGEIMEEGAPNAAGWLGLDRRAFQSTACVRQADIQDVLQNADALQVHLQRAAATAGGDATAAAALTALHDYQAEHVGTERANSKRPLRNARVALADAQAALVEARDAHGEYLRRVVRVEELGAAAAHASHARRLFDARLARTLADSAQAAHKRARELADRYPQEPPDALDDGVLAEQFATALDAWRRRPSVDQLTGPTAAELRSELEALSLPPEGETAPAAEVVAAKRSLDSAVAVLEAHERQRPHVPAQVDAGGMLASDLRRLADDLSVAEPPHDESIDQRVVEAEEALERASQTRLLPALVAAVAALGGVLALALGAIAVGVVFLLLACGALAAALYGRRPAARAAALAELRQAQEEAAAQHALRTSYASRVDAARTEAEAHGVTADAPKLRDLASSVEEFERLQRDADRWRERSEELRQAVRELEDALAAALASRGAVGDDVMATLARYEGDCRMRRAQADQASRRPRLEREIASRLQLEETNRAQTAALLQTRELLDAAAGAAGVSGSTAKALVDGLGAWQARREESMREREQERKEWHDLQALLGGGTVQDLDDAAQERATRAAELARGLDARAIAATTIADDPDAQARDLHEEERASAAASANEQGALDNFRRTMPSVPEAEERVARCNAELERVRALGEVLAATQQFLEQAQESVHRDLAPVLRDTLRPWLPRVTAGRYQDVMVDPATLTVRVRAAGRSWREARLLSHGTAEQIYLLLRVAMAKHLTLAKEVCPLILDDVTVQCDSARRSAVLDLLRSLSGERQVVLFSQEAEVLAWARENLTGANHRVIELEADATAP